MRKILLVAAATATLAVACQAAYGQDLTTIRLAQATTTAPAADTAPAAPRACGRSCRPTGSCGTGATGRNTDHESVQAREKARRQTPLLGGG